MCDGSALITSCGLSNQQTSGNQAINIGHIQYINVDFYFARDL